MKKLIMTAALAAVTCGCISVHKNDGGDACLKPRICKDAVHEKYSVADKPITVKATAIGIMKLFVIRDPEATHIADQTPDRFAFGSVPAAKNAAYAKACEQAKCDSIVGARYKVTNTNYFVYDTTTVELTGYPAKLVGVELAPCCKKACPAAK